MTDAPRRIVVGLLPTGGSVMYASGSEDPVAIAIREAGAELDRQRAEEERARAAKAADIARLTNTRGARNMRKLRRALRAFGVSI